MARDVDGLNYLPFETYFIDVDEIMYNVLFCSICNQCLKPINNVF